MTGDDAAGPPLLDDAERRRRRQDSAVVAATWVGCVVAAIGLIDGVAMAVRRKEAPCADGTVLPEGTTDFTCYVHPQAGLGIGIAAISVLLGILVVFGCLTVRASLGAGSSAG